MRASIALSDPPKSAPERSSPAAYPRVIQYDSMPETERRIVVAFLAVAKAPSTAQAGGAA